MGKNYPTAIKALALDLDGTTLLPDTSLGDRTTECLKRLIAKGIQVILCTGRSIQASQQYYSAIGAEGPMVFCNGAEVADIPKVTLIRSNLLSLDVVDYGIDLARSMDIHFQVFCPPQNKQWETLLIEKETPESEMYHKHTGIVPVITDIKALIAGGKLSGVPIPGIVKSMFIADPSLLGELRNKMFDRFGSRIYITGSHPTFLEIMNAGVSKGEGLKTAMDCRSLKPEEVMACGDEENDLPMFSVAGFSAAPSSAREKVREAADFIFGPHAEEGLAAFLDDMFK